MKKLLLIMWLLPLTVYADKNNHDEKHHNQPPEIIVEAPITVIVPDQPAPNITVTPTPVEFHESIHNHYYNEKSRGIAIGYALGGFNYDMATPSWQGSVSVGWFRGNNAIALGVAKRVCSKGSQKADKCILFNGGVGLEERGYSGGNFAANWRF